MRKCFNEAYVFKRPMDHKAHLSNTMNYEHFRFYTIAGCFHIHCNSQMDVQKNYFFLGGGDGGGRWGVILLYGTLHASRLWPLHWSVGHRDALLVYRTFLKP